MSQQRRAALPSLSVFAVALRSKSADRTPQHPPSYHWMLVGLGSAQQAAGACARKEERGKKKEERNLVLLERE